jgi:site-specific recombinase XerD
MKRAVGFSGSIQAFRLFLQVQGLRPHTVSYYCREVERLARRFPGRGPSSIGQADLRVYVLGLSRNLSPKTVREGQLALRRFFRFLVQEGEIRKDPTQGMKLMAFRVTPQPTYSEAEVKQLLLVCNARTLRGVRDAAMVMVLFDAGVPEGELVSMSLPEWNRRRIMVSGKTGVRAVPLGVSSLLALERYVRRWRLDAGPLWWGGKGPLTESGVLQVVRRLCRAGGVTHKGVHGFRRAAAAQMKRLGMNDSDILEVMGWRNITMLRRYTAEVAEELAFAAHERFSPGDALKTGRIQPIA